MAVAGKKFDLRRVRQEMRCVSKIGRTDDAAGKFRKTERKA
jgi:hypothetical protein